jgi:hypothetical protein
MPALFLRNDGDFDSVIPAKAGKSGVRLKFFDGDPARSEGVGEEFNQTPSLRAGCVALWR